MHKPLLPAIAAGCLWLLSAVAVADDLPSPHRPDAVSEVNAIAGNLSWRERYGREPTGADDADERARLQTHLRWVRAELEARDVSHLPPELRARRERLLAALERYTEKAEFPHNEHVAGRRPRFIDDAGRICAVGFLIEADRGRALALSVDEQNEYSYLLDMRHDALAAWVSTSGFSARELAMVQPSYNFRPGDGIGPVEPPPPPARLTAAELQATLIGSAARVRACADDDATPPQRVHVRLRHSRSTGLRARVRSTPRRRAFERCVEGAVVDRILTLHRGPPATPIRAVRSFQVRVPTRPAAALVHAVRALIDARLPYLQTCMAPETRERRGSATLRVRVDAEGALSLVGARLPRRTPQRGGLPGGFAGQVSDAEVLSCLSTQVATLTIDNPGPTRVIRHRIPYGGSRTPAITQAFGGYPGTL